MSDFDDLRDEVAAKAALAAGTRAARRALGDALLDDTEREARVAERAKQGKRRRTKLIIYGVLALLLVVGLIGFALSYWHWFLIGGVLGLVGLYAASRVRRRVRSLKEARAERRKERMAPPREQEQAPAARARVTQGPSPEELEDKRLEAERARERDLAAEAEARAQQAQAVEDDLAALKARLGK